MSEWITSSEPYLAPRDPAAGDPWREEAARAGRVGAHKVVLIARRAPDERVGHLLGLAPGAPAVLRRRLVTLDEVPVEVSDSWYPAEIADGTPLAADRPIKGGALRALADLGFTGVRHVEEVAVVDTPAEIEKLLPVSPVIELTRTSYTARDLAFEVSVMHMCRDLAPGVPRRLRYSMRTDRL
jgi:DNA-binding GntR family transcriptional regulator